jgi:hypothetical protein
MSVSLTSSPRAFKESVCPAASESKKSCLSQLGFRQRLRACADRDISNLSCPLKALN